MVALWECLQRVRGSPQIPAKVLACLLGQIASMFIALGPSHAFDDAYFVHFPECRVAWCQ